MTYRSPIRATAASFDDRLAAGGIPATDYWTASELHHGSAADVSIVGSKRRVTGDGLKGMFGAVTVADSTTYSADIDGQTVTTTTPSSGTTLATIVSGLAADLVTKGLGSKVGVDGLDDDGDGADDELYFSSLDGTTFTVGATVNITATRGQLITLGRDVWTTDPGRLHEAAFSVLYGVPTIGDDFSIRFGIAIDNGTIIAPKTLLDGDQANVNQASSRVVGAGKDLQAATHRYFAGVNSNGSGLVTPQADATPETADLVASAYLGFETTATAFQVCSFSRSSTGPGSATQNGVNRAQTLGLAGDVNRERARLYAQLRIFGSGSGPTSVDIGTVRVGIA